MGRADIGLADVPAPLGPLLARARLHRGVADGVDTLGGRLAVLGWVEVEPAVGCRLVLFDRDSVSVGPGVLADAGE